MVSSNHGPLKIDDMVMIVAGGGGENIGCVSTVKEIHPVGLVGPHWKTGLSVMTHCVGYALPTKDLRVTGVNCELTLFSRDELMKLNPDEKIRVEAGLQRILDKLKLVKTHEEMQEL